MSDQFAPKSNLIIVAYDFTKESECALQHVNNIAKASKSSIDIVHIITKDTKDKNEVRIKLNKIAEQNQLSTGIITTATAQEGDIFTTIGQIAEAKNAWYVSFGTHGVKGMQHILGAFALKVVSSSPCPVIIVQNKNIADHGYKNILLPIDKSKQSKQKVYQAIALAKIYNCNIHLFGGHETDEQFLMNLKGNVGFVKNKLEEHGFSLASENYQDPKSKDGFATQTMRYASEHDIDLMLIIADEGNGVLGGIIGSEDVKIINNDAQIPVMCINATNFQILGSIISFGGFG